VIKRTKLLIKKSIIVAAIAFASLLVAVQAPQIHGDWIRSKVGSQVVILTNRANRGGGTGFAVKAPSGDVYTLTNAHVCEMAPDGIYAVMPNKKKLPLKVIEVSETHDLCLLSGLRVMSGLSLAGNVEIGEEVGLVGHPKLMPLTLSRGQLIGYSRIVVLVSYGECPANSPAMFKTHKALLGSVCLMDVEAGLTNIVALPGNSGSPVVNVFGNVIGVLFASDSQGYWGSLVPLSAVKEFLKGY
jgi:S1-C subfamily serine protease